MVSVLIMALSTDGWISSLLAWVLKSWPICIRPASRPTLPQMMLSAFWPIPLDVVSPMTSVGTSETQGRPELGRSSNEVFQARVSPNTDDANFSLILIAKLDRLRNTILLKIARILLYIAKHELHGEKQFIFIFWAVFASLALSS